jgi:putative ABC transport system substrate-binding protein
MRRREFIGIVSLAVSPRAALAQASDRHVRVGLLMDGPLAALGAFKMRLEQLGYLEGRNLDFIERWTDARPERAMRFAAELVSEKPDAIVTYGTRATLAMMEATKAIPIITAAVSDELTRRIFVSLARPSGNVTGFVSLSASLWNKRLALARELIPQLRRVAYLSVPNAPNSPGIVRNLSEAASGLGITVQALEFANLEGGLASALREQSIEAVFVATGDAFRHRAAEITRFMADLRKPAFYGARDLVEAGGLISYGPDYAELFRRTADYTDRVLRGEKPSNLPAQQAERFKLVSNLKTARALGLEIPPALLARADEVIE